MRPKNGRTEIIFGNSGPTQQPRVIDSAPIAEKEQKAMSQPLSQEMNDALDVRRDDLTAIHKQGPAAMAAFMDRVVAVFNRNKRSEVAARRSRVLAAAEKHADDDAYVRMYGTKGGAK